MKKNLALLLAVVLVFTSMLGLTAAASSGDSSAAPSQEVKYTNVSLKVGATVLFAVPAEGYSVKADGTVDNLQLLVFEESANPTLFNVGDARKCGEVLEASGRTYIRGEEYIIFSYSGLAASQMAETIYFRTVYTNKDGYRSYGKIGTYSITEFAKRYDGEFNSLVSSMLAYGDAAAEAYNVTGLRANYKASEAKDLYTIKVKRYLDGVALDAVAFTSQLAKAGEVTLDIPHVDGANFKSWEGETVTDGKITVDGDVTLNAYYETNNATDFELNFESGTVGAILSTSNRTGTATTIGAPSSAPNTSTNWTSNATVAGFAHFEVCGDDDDKYLKYAHNGAGQLNLGNSWATTGLGDNVGFTFSIDIMANENGTLPETQIRIDRVGTATGATGGYAADLLRLKANGDIVLCSDGGVDEYGMQIVVETVLCRASSSSFTTVSVVFDCKTGYVTGYVNGVEEASGLATFPVLNYYASFDAQANTRFRFCMFGGAGAANWAGAIGYPKSLVDAGHFTFTEAANGALIYDEDLGRYRALKVVKDAAGKEVFIEEGYENATRYKVSYTASDASRAAISEYVVENEYFYYDNVTVKYGNAVSN